MKSLLFGIIFLLLTHRIVCLESSEYEKPIVVVIPSYNNLSWYEANISSVLTQEYKNYRIIYVNDCSKDGTGEAVENYLTDKHIEYRVVYFDAAPGSEIHDTTRKFEQLVNEEPSFFTLVHNIYRHGALANLYRSIYSCSNHVIIATVDGDDWLYHDQVLKELNEIYSKKEVWLTHGRIIEYPSGHSNWCLKIPYRVVKQNAFRGYRCPSHLRTFYAGLFKKIKLDDLLYNGRFFPMTWDMAMMYPMIEMAGERHVYIDNINYVYNMANQLNDNKVDPDLQNKLDQYIRSMPPYRRLKNKEMDYVRK